MYMFGPLAVSFVMESLTCTCKNTLDHIPIISIFIRLKLLRRLKPLWAELYEKREKIEKLNIKKIEETQEEQATTELIASYQKVLSKVTRLEVQLLESNRYEILCESAPQAILQISIFLQTGNWTKVMALGVCTSTLSLALGFINFYTLLPTEDTTISISKKSTHCSKVKKYFTGFIIFLCTPCNVLMMAMLVSYINIYVFPLFVSVSFLSVLMVQSNNFASSNGFTGIKGKMMKGSVMTVV